MYSQTKDIHKPGASIRPVFSYSGYQLYSYNIYLANILKTYIKDENCNAKNSTILCSNYIRNVPIEDEEMMYHFKSLSDFMGKGATQEKYDRRLKHSFADILQNRFS